MANIKKKVILKNILTVFIVFASVVSSSAQKNMNEAFFTSDAITLSLDNNIVVSIKKYNATAEQIKNASSFDRNQPMSYLQLPFEATGAELYEKEFESVLICFDRNGNALWQSQLGYSKNSSPSPVDEYNDFLYTGSCMKDANKVLIQKIDKKGKTVWTCKLDSLENLNAIFVFNNRVNALVSFDHFQKIEDPVSKTFSINSFPIFHFVQLNIETGAVIKKEYQAMTNYLSSKKFKDPIINSDYSYLLHSNDSLAYLTVMTQTTATIVSGKLEANSRIIGVAADSGSYHYLVSKNSRGNNTVSVFSDYYEKDPIKYNSQLPAENNSTTVFRSYIIKTDTDSLYTLFNGTNSMYMSFTDRKGKTSLYKKLENPNKYLPIATGLLNGAPYVITMEGRKKPGETGKIRILF